MKNPLVWLVIVIILVGGYFAFANKESQVPTEEAGVTESVVTDGSYTVVAEESEVGWAGKKPLIDGYINSGSIAVSEGMIAVSGATASGSFVIDMDTLSVSSTPTKPGQEGALEGHLKGERWFNVAAYPTATFEITNVVARGDSAASHTYDVTGMLTMKGETHEVSFPAQIYLDESDRLHASAETEIDRTLWGITSGSGNFFENLADNVIDDMVALSFHIVAERN